MVTSLAFCALVASIIAGKSAGVSAQPAEACCCGSPFLCMLTACRHIRSSEKSPLASAGYIVARNRGATIPWVERLCYVLQVRFGRHHDYSVLHHFDPESSISVHPAFTNPASGPESHAVREISAGPYSPPAAGQPSSAYADG